MAPKNQKSGCCSQLLAEDLGWCCFGVAPNRFGRPVFPGMPGGSSEGLKS